MRRRLTMLLPLLVAMTASVVPLGVGVSQAQQSGPCLLPPLQYPPARPGLTLSTTIVARGDTIEVTGCADPAAGVSFVLSSHPQNLGSTVADGTGFYRAVLLIPCSTEDGAHTLTASGAGVTDGSAGLTVRGVSGACVGGVQSGARAGGGLLPRTGAYIAGLAALGVVLVLFGTLAVYLTRRRRTGAGQVAGP